MSEWLIKKLWLENISDGCLNWLNYDLWEELLNMLTRLAFSSTKSAALSILVAVVAGGMVVGTSARALAQVSTTADPLKDIHSDGSNDPFSNRGGNQTSSMMDFIHRAMQGQSQSPEDFTSAQQENLDAAAEAFRRAQKERLANPQAAPAPSAPATPAGTR